METENKPFDQTLKRDITKEELGAFYKEDLPKLLKTFFSEPIGGTYAIFSNRSDKAYLHSLILIISTGLIYIVFSWLMLGAEGRQYISFSKNILIGVGAIIFLLVVSGLSLGIKLISGKADFRNELLTGGISGIPLSALIIALFVLKLFSSISLESLLNNPFALMQRGAFFSVLVLYLLLMLINIFQQSLKSSGTKDVISWYASPAAIMAAFYITYKIGVSLM